MSLQAVPEIEWDESEVRTIWGLDPIHLHDQYWAAHGLQVVRPGDESPIRTDALGYLLLNPGLMVLFSPDKFKDRQTWHACDLIYLRIHESSSLREHVVTDDESRFVRFERSYRGTRSSHANRIAITSDSRLAGLWQVAATTNTAVKKLRQVVPRNRRAVVSALGSLYAFPGESGSMAFLRDVMRVWANPQAVIRRAAVHGKSVWLDSDMAAPSKTQFVGPVWVGAGRDLDGAQMVIGPAVLWDHPAARPVAQELMIDPLGGASITVTSQPANLRSNRRPVYRFAKRVFDICFAVFVLAMTLPLYPFVMLAIWLEDGRPFFFTHSRETLYGRRFGCIKFRSMHKNAEKIKLDLARQNQADGPQFFMEIDPRLTRVGKFLRDCNIDELPQFFNVLVGHMSVVGPRPSPFKENQFCPPWREARLSVRPGITGLWQVKRTREKDKDFQEWIRYDIEYVENAGLRMDAWIIFQTIANMVGRLGAILFRFGRWKVNSPVANVDAGESLETSV